MNSRKIRINHLALEENELDPFWKEKKMLELTLEITTGVSLAFEAIFGGT